MRSLLNIVLLASALAATACNLTNTSHCGNRDGDLTCAAQDPATPYCSICVADNNGCLAEVPEDKCLGPNASQSGTSAAPSTGDASSTTTVTPTSTSGTGSNSGSSSSGDPTTTTSTTTTTTDPTTTTGPTTDTSTGDTTTTTSTTTSTDSSSDTTLTTLTTLSTTDESTSSSTTEDTTTGGGPMCGNNIKEGQEECDGTDVGNTCSTYNPLWGGGKLKCKADCQTFDETGCCIKTGGKCSDQPSNKCCSGKACPILGLGTCPA